MNARQQEKTERKWGKADRLVTLEEALILLPQKFRSGENRISNTSAKQVTFQF